MKITLLFSFNLLQCSLALPPTPTSSIARIIPRATGANPQVSLAPDKPARPPSEAFDPLAQPKFVQHSNWVDIHCLAYEQSLGGSSIWKNVNASEALTETIAAWNHPDRVKIFPELLFPSFIWSMFRILPNTEAICGQLTADTVCDQYIACNQDTDRVPPGGVAIMNSFVSLHTIMTQRQEALDATQETVEAGLLNLVRLFAPEDDDIDDKQKGTVALNVVEAAVGLVSAGTLSSAFQSVKAFAKIADFARVVRDVVAVGASAGKVSLEAIEKLDPPETNDDTKGRLSDTLIEYSKALEDANNNFLTYITSGDTGSIQALVALLETGVLLDLATDADGYTHFTKVMKDTGDALLWGTMIKEAWKISPKAVRPFILRVDKNEPGHKCNDTIGDGLKTYLHPDAAKKAVWCDKEGNSFYLLNAIRNVKAGINPDIGDFRDYTFEMLPGGDNETLNGVSVGGITLADIFTSAYAGFLENSQNGYIMDEASVLQAQDDFSTQDLGGLPMLGGVRVPGFFNFTICLNYTEAAHNILSDLSKSEPPCGQKPWCSIHSPGCTVSKAFAPGICKVKVEQWAKDSGDHLDNRLQEYQTEIRILDNNGDEAGNAARDAAEDPRVVINSNLPYQLIVNAWGDGEADDEIVEFWYSDQWWLSIDQEHKCNFKPWSHNYRTGECEFACPPAPREGDQPPPSAIASRVPKEALETAIPGSITFKNWIPEPTENGVAENYAYSSPGSGPGCGVHVNQYKHKDGDSYKFEVEAYVSDSMQNIVAYTGKAFAFPGKPVPARSCQPDDPGEFCMRDFYVWVDANPKEVVSFKFKNQEWNTNSTTYDCGVGDYDGSKRQIDCGFSCPAP